MSKKYRSYGKAGEVVAVPLREGLYVYLCFTSSCKCYIYNLRSKGVIVDLKSFSKVNWLTSISFVSKVPIEWLTVAKIELTEEERLPWRVDKVRQGAGFAYVANNGVDYRPATEAEIERSLTYIDTICTDFERDITPLLLTMPLVIAAPGAPLPSPAPENTDVQLQIMNLDEEFYYTLPEDIAEEADKAGIYLDWISSEPVYNSRRSEVVKALKLIRREIKKVVPKDQWEDMEIVVSGQSDDDIQHYPVEAKRKK